MRHRVRTRSVLSRALLVPVLAVVLVVVLAACGAAPDAVDAGDRLAPQASGSFSGGSLSRGSVEGLFEGVGLGNKQHVLEMTVDGVVWFECRNNGGNLAPGQYAYTTTVQTPIDGTIDQNGRFEQTVKASVDPRLLPTDDDCKRNWTVEADDDGPVTFLQVVDSEEDADPYAVTADLFEVQDDGSLLHRDTLLWTCDDPEPTSPLSAYEPPDLSGAEGVCTLVTDAS